LHERRFGGDRHDFRRAADLNRHASDGHNRSGADRDAGASQRAERRHFHLNRVGVSGDVREDEVSGGIRDDRRRRCAARAADEGDGRTWNHAPLSILHRAGNRSGDTLRYRRRGHDEGDGANGGRIPQHLSNEAH
jgi:hypothetical protein